MCSYVKSFVYSFNNAMKKYHSVTENLSSAIIK